jgi:hypothetical protein
MMLQRIMVVVLGLLYPEAEDTIILWNIRNFWLDNIVSWPSRPKSSPTPLREIQILL